MKKLGRSVAEYEKLLNQAVKVSGINLNLPHPKLLTPKDLLSTQAEYRWTAASLLSRYEQQNQIPHSLERSAVIKIDQANKVLKIISLVALSNLELPSVAFLLDYNSKKWFRLHINLSTRNYRETNEMISFGASFSFSLATITYEIIECLELTKEEITETQKFFNHNWITGNSPKCVELNSWIDGEFRRQYVVGGAKSNLELRIEQSELFYINLSGKKSAA